MTYKLPAGRRTIRIEAAYEDKKASHEKTILILGSDARQTMEIKLDFR